MPTIKQIKCEDYFWKENSYKTASLSESETICITVNSWQDSSRLLKCSVLSPIGKY